MTNNSERSINTRGGRNNINNTGDNPFFGDIYVVPPPSNPRKLNRTVLYSFCKQFSETTLPEAIISDSHALPSEIDNKMNYNEIQYYREVFINCDIYLNDVEEILIQIPKREVIILKIARIYRTKKLQNNWNNKDQLCSFVFEELMEVITNDPLSGQLFNEETELAIEALMYYAFTKCKLLDPVPERTEV